MLDLTQPHDQVFGLPGVAWSQEGRLYDVAGHCVTYRREDTGELDGSGDPVSRTIVTRIEDEAPKPKIAAAPVTEGLEDLDWRHLKAMMSQYDQPWTTKDHAIAFLRGRR